MNELRAGKLLWVLQLPNAVKIPNANRKMIFKIWSKRNPNDFHSVTQIPLGFALEIS
jgi:hypothetical protein